MLWSDFLYCLWLSYGENEDEDDEDEDDDDEYEEGGVFEVTLVWLPFTLR